jgi:clan AA aspartic protease
MSVQAEDKWMEQNMGLVFADIELLSGDDLALHRRGYITDDQIHRCTTQAMVDSGATMLAIPEYVKTQLDLRKLREIEAEFADGSCTSYEVVGPVEVRFENRQTTVEALVVPGAIKVLLGAIPMEGMDVLIGPKRERLLVNPDSPNVAKMMLM